MYRRAHKGVAHVEEHFSHTETVNMTSSVLRGTQSPGSINYIEEKRGGFEKMLDTVINLCLTCLVETLKIFQHSLEEEQDSSKAKVAPPLRREKRGGAVIFTRSSVKSTGLRTVKLNPRLLAQLRQQRDCNGKIKNSSPVSSSNRRRCSSESILEAVREETQEQLIEWCHQQ